MLNFPRYLQIESQYFLTWLIGGRCWYLHFPWCPSHEDQYKVILYRFISYTISQQSYRGTIEELYYVIDLCLVLSRLRISKQWFLEILKYEKPLTFSGWDRLYNLRRSRPPQRPLICEIASLASSHSKNKILCLIFTERESGIHNTKADNSADFRTPQTHVI